MRYTLAGMFLISLAALGAAPFVRAQEPLREPGAPIVSEFDLFAEPLDPLWVDPRLREPTLREAAAISLGRIGRAAARPLITALADPDPAIRLQAARALGRMGPEADEAVAPLARALKDTDRSVRLAAARALGQIGPAAEDAIPALIEALRAPDDLPGETVAPLPTPET